MRRGEAVLITVLDRQGVFFTVQVFKKKYDIHYRSGNIFATK